MEPSYAFIGGGNMSRALIGGLVAAGHPASRIRVAEPVAASREALAAQYGVATFTDSVDAAAGADVVVLAVKPQQLREVALALAPRVSPGQLYLSIAAGITLGHLEAWLGAVTALVRCMPNTPAQIGCGAAALCANPAVTADQRTLAGRLLEAVGVAVWLEDESLMDAVTALSGSGPAYVFLLLELLEAAGTDLGLPADLARTLALATVEGAARLARASSDDPATLRRQVTSPGGTTERALAAFNDADLAGIVTRALRAARDRGRELAAGVPR
jgi:pyrroline-5-carboxylate reductase